MNHEAELAQLLIQMGADRGVDTETILAELSWAQFPSFVDAEAVRASLVDAVESWWRADLESRINQLRNQYVAGASGSAQFGATPDYQAPASYQHSEAFEPAPEPYFEPEPEPVIEPEPTPAPQIRSWSAASAPLVEQPPLEETASAVEPEPETSLPIPEPVEDATIEGMAVEAADTPKPPKSMPSDATMIWNTRGG